MQNSLFAMRCSENYEWTAWMSYVISSANQNNGGQHEHLFSGIVIYIRIMW